MCRKHNQTRMQEGSSKDTSCRRCKKSFDACKCDEQLSPETSRKRCNLDFGNPGKAWAEPHAKRQSKAPNLFIKSHAMEHLRAPSCSSKRIKKSNGSSAAKTTQNKSIQKPRVVKKSKEVLDADSSSHESDMQDDDGRSESAISSDELQLDEGDRFEYFQADNPYVGLERANDGSLYYDEDNHEIQNAADAAFVVADVDKKKISELDVEGWKSVANERKYSDPTCKEYGKSERQVQCQRFYMPHCSKTGSVDRQDAEAQFEGFRPGSCILLSVGNMNVHVVLVSCIHNPDSSIRIGFTLDYPDRQRKEIETVLTSQHNAHINGERVEMTLDDSMHVVEVDSDSDACCSEHSWFFDSDSHEQPADMDQYDTEQESARETDQSANDSASSSDVNGQDDNEPPGPKSVRY